MPTTLQLLTTLTTLTLFSSSTAASSFASLLSLPFPSPPPPPPTQCDLATILSALGFHQLSIAAASSSLTNTTTPITIFAPTDSSLLTCPSCSLPLLLLEHSVPYLYPLHRLRNFAFSTKIHTLAPNRCLSVTSTSSSTATIFINGAEITRPDLYITGNFIVHGLQGFLSHLSPLSCNLEHMTTISLPPPAPVVTASAPSSVPAFSLMPLMLKDAMLKLRTTGYSVLALAMRDKYTELLNLRSLTLFALDDGSIFTGGPNYVSDLMFHIVQNRRLLAADLENLPVNTVLPTMEPGQNLVVTTAGGGGPLAPMRINYVKIKCGDLVFNSRIAVHGLSMPFRRINNNAPAPDGGLCQIGRSGLEREGSCKVDEMVDPNSGPGSMVDVEDHHGL